MDEFPALEPAPAPRQNWTYSDVLAVTAFAVGAQILAYLGGVLVLLLVRQLAGATFSFPQAMTRTSFIVPVQLLWWVLVFWIVYRVVRARDPRPFGQAIGWVRPPLPVGTYLGGGALLALSVAAL